MIRKFEKADISYVAGMHYRELKGFLPELGISFLEKFYRVSLEIDSMFTIVNSEDDHIVGFVCGVEKARGLYKKIIYEDPAGFILLFLKYFVTHPVNSLKLIKILLYPGFVSDDPELLSIAVQKNHQKKGIGRKLFNECCREYKRRNIFKFKVSVYKKLAANGFYKKMGCSLYSTFLFLGQKMNYYTYVIKT